jgi:hypothetical protein
MSNSQKRYHEEYMENLVKEKLEGKIDNGDEIQPIDDDSYPMDWY